jgi:hypothetical protein
MSNINTVLGKWVHPHSFIDNFSQSTYSFSESFLVTSFIIVFIYVNYSILFLTLDEYERAKQRALKVRESTFQALQPDTFTF